MKNLVYKITLISLSLLAFKLDANQDSQITNAKDSIRYAIKKSKPDLLKKALVGIELTEKEKYWLSTFANEVIQIRRNKMNLNLIKPKHKSSPYNDYLLLSIITFFAGSGITCVSLGIGIENFKDGAIVLPIITGAATFFAIKKLMAIGKKKNEEYFALHPYRSYKQKYLDSINVLELIQSN